MKYFNRIISVLVVLLAVGSVLAQYSLVSGSMNPVQTDDDTTILMGNEISEAEADSLLELYRRGEGLSVEQQRALLRDETKLSLLARAYGDSIVLRWAVDDNVAWDYLRKVGVTILRKDGDNPSDTIVKGFKPLTLEEMRARYPQNDSIAMAAVGMLYGKGEIRADQTKTPAGSLGSMVEMYEDRQLKMGYAFLVAEWRTDVADAMALRFADKNVKKGHTYSYSVQPTVIDTTRTVRIQFGAVLDVKNTEYNPAPYTVQVKDSIEDINCFLLSWPQGNYNSFEIERRDEGNNEWKRLTSRPYMMIANSEHPDSNSYITNMVPKPGVYEYRLFAHDAFGELVGPGPVIKAVMPDIEPPKAPEIHRISIDRRNPDDLTSDVFATIYFKKDTVEQDFVGSLPMYHNKYMGEKDWTMLSKDYIAASDTSVTVDVTGLPTGTLIMVALDTANNVGYSMPQEIRITDLKAPKPPYNLGYKANLENGTVTLSWDADDNDIDYFEILAANDTTHEFLEVNREPIRRYMFVDTLSMTVNQKYKYYKVRAIDFSTNVGPCSEVLQVIRPNLVKPEMPRIDSLWVVQRGADKGVYMRWAVANNQTVSRHVLMRRIRGQKNWQTIRVFDADSVKKNSDMIEVKDVPEFNREKKYEYAMQSFTAQNVASDMSLAYGVKFQGELYFQWPIKLFGDYDQRRGEVHIAWETEDNLPYKGDYYFCIYCKGPKDKDPHFLFSADKKERSFSDKNLLPGEEAQYYIFIQYEDGRKTSNSNVVTVKAPMK